MNTQKHHIQRQVFEIAVSRRELADVLQDKLPKLQQQNLEALVDACCSAVSSPDRVHRLGRVEVNLGRLSVENLEQELLDKLGPALREELTKRVWAAEEDSARVGEDPAVQARLELVSLFARTGTLPFWADAGNAKLVDETVIWLLARAPGDLRALVQWLAGDRHALERLVRHVEAMQLLALLKVLVETRGARGADARAAEAWEALGVLGGKVPRGKVPATFADVGQHVSARVPPTVDTPHDRPSPGFSNAGGTPNSPNTRAKTVGSPPPASTFADVGQQPSHNVPTPLVWLAILTTAASSQRLTDAPQFWEQALARLATMAGASYASLLARWSHAPSDDASVFATLARTLVTLPRNAAHAQTTSTGRSPTFTGSSSTLTDASRASATDPSTLTGASRASATDSSTLTGASRTAATDPSTLTYASRASATDPSTLTGASRASATAPSTLTDASPTSAKASTTLERSSSLRATPTTSPAPRPSRTTSTDPDEVYLDTSGLVLLWPFLANFFGRVGLVLEGKTFVDDAARHRSVFLLHWLTTGEWNPPEFRLPLAKVLCGVPLDDVLDTPDELTETEETEGARLLAATLEHLKGFGFLDLEHFRRSFLFRRGVLTTQNNTWLLRVERAPYDLVLQKLPWPLQWIMLPWMAAPLYVEWVK